MEEKYISQTRRKNSFCKFLEQTHVYSQYFSKQNFYKRGFKIDIKWIGLCEQGTSKCSPYLNTNIGL